jgi:hypothetical protein
MKKKLFVFSFFAIGILTGCSNSSIDSTESLRITNNQTTTDFYYPLTKGSTWTYTGTQNYTQRVLGDTTLNGKTYAIIGMYRFDDYLTSTARAYWADSKFSSLGMYVTSSTEIVTLDTIPNSMWSTNSTVNDFTHHYDFVTAERGLIHTVLGKEYSNVIKVHVDWSYINGGQTSTQHFDYYYAKGIGLIEVASPELGNIYLQSYSIK